MKWTNGPWIAEIDEAGIPQIVTVHEPYIKICSMNNTLMPMQELIANTRLLSASPELLGGLKIAIDLLSKNPDFKLVVERLNAVIAQAGG